MKQNSSKIINCPYCGKEAEWVENKEIYGKNYGKSYMMYLCRPCDAYVGCHNNTRRPLGTLANSQTRMWRKATHSLIDPFWKSRKITRRKMYKILNRHFGKEVHVGESSVEMCKKIIEVVKGGILKQALE